MGTVREKPEMELDQGSVEQIRKLFNDYVVDPLGKELKEAESQIKSDEATQMGTLKNDLETKLDGTNGRLEDVLRALGNPKEPLANLQSKLDDLGEKLENDLENKLTAPERDAGKQPDEPFGNASGCPVREPCGKYCPAYGAERCRSEGCAGKSCGVGAAAAHSGG